MVLLSWSDDHEPNCMGMHHVCSLHLHSLLQSELMSWQNINRSWLGWTSSCISAGILKVLHNDRPWAITFNSQYNCSLIELTRETYIYANPLARLGSLPLLIPITQGCLLVAGFLLYPESLKLFQPIVNLERRWQHLTFTFLESISATMAWSVGIFRIVCIIWILSVKKSWLLVLRRTVQM